MNFKLIVGLGNPGAEYEDTYHNVGMLALAAIATHGEKGGETLRFKRHGDLFEYTKAGSTIFVRPLVFMNESGRAVADALHAFGIASQELLILQDDTDLAIGKYKIAAGQNSAGHHGVDSIIESLGGNDFTRTRIGIRATDEPRRKKAAEFVLAPITPEDKKIFAGVFAEITEKLGMS
jgi:peptidyl-tRNA hydrolase, PTH1 family